MTTTVNSITVTATKEHRGNTSVFIKEADKWMLMKEDIMVRKSRPQWEFRMYHNGREVCRSAHTFNTKAYALESKYATNPDWVLEEHPEVYGTLTTVRRALEG